MTHLLAGASTVDITPSTPQWLDGYGNRTAPSEGAYQTISAKGLALRSGETTAVLVAAEVLGFDRARVGALKRRIAERTGLPEDAVVLTATHTHCAPRVCDMSMPGEVDPEYRAWFEDRCAEAAESALGRLAPVRARLSRAEDTLGINRRVRTETGVVMRPNREGTHDREIQTLWLEEPATGACRASLTVAACHPTSRGGQLIGGDYPGFLTRELEGTAGGTALFVLGCAGDVRPHFTSEAGGFRMATLEEVETAGRGLGRAVLEGREAAEPVACERVCILRRTVTIPLAEPPSERELRATAEGDASPMRREWARRLLDAGPSRRPGWIVFEIQALVFDPGLVAVFWPGEVVSDYALWLKSPDNGRKPAVIAAAYSNGALGYVPSAAIYPFGGYEVNGSHFYYNLPAPYAPDVEARLRGATLELLAGYL